MTAAAACRTPQSQTSHPPFLVRLQGTGKDPDPSLAELYPGLGPSQPYWCEIRLGGLDFLVFQSSF